MSLSPQLSEWFLSAQDQSLTLARELADCLRRERKALIEWRIEEVMLTTSQKEDLTGQLKRIRMELRHEMQGRAGLNSLEEIEKVLSLEFAKVWKDKDREWRMVWDEVKNLCETNQQFMEHSQRNMALILDNWRRLVGDQPRYSSRGQQINKASTGKVIEKSL